MNDYWNDPPDEDYSHLCTHPEEEWDECMSCETCGYPCNAQNSHDCQEIILDREAEAEAERKYMEQEKKWQDEMREAGRLDRWGNYITDLPEDAPAMTDADYFASDFAYDAARERQLMGRGYGRY